MAKEYQPVLPMVGSELWAAIKSSAPLVTRLLVYPGDGIISLKVSYRGENDWLAIAKRYGEDGTIDVCFGSGLDYVGAILGLDRALDNDKWRPDKFQSQGK